MAKRGRFIIAALALATAGAFAFPRHAPVLWLVAEAQGVTPFVPVAGRLPTTDAARALIDAATGQVGVVTIYDPAYVALTFPGGDVAPERGVCTDVLIRALRVGHGIDLQVALNRDMQANFAKYPAQWGLTTTDRNIDHRRVPNLRRLFERMGAEVTGDYLPGDVVTMLLPGNLAHIVVVTDLVGQGGPMIVHNIGAGTRVEDRLFAFEVTGHYRLTPKVLAALRARQG